MEELLESTQSTHESRYVGLENMAESIEMKSKCEIEVQLREVKKQDAKEETLNDVDLSDDYNKVDTVNNPSLLEAKKNAEEVGNVKTGSFHRSFGVDRSRVIKKRFGGKKRKCGSKQRQRRYTGKEVIQREATKESSPKLVEALDSKGGVEGEAAVNNEHEIYSYLAAVNRTPWPITGLVAFEEPDINELMAFAFEGPPCHMSSLPDSDSLEECDVNKLERFKVRTFVLGEAAGGGGGGNGGGAQGGNGGVGVGN